MSVGRLDINSSGLLLITNDGALAHALMHPSTGLDREYVVRVAGLIDEEIEHALREGVELDGSIARFTDISRQSGTGYNHWYHVTLMEGRNREVRRLLESQGIQVSRLKRVRYGPVILPASLRRGHWHEMSAADVGELYRVLGLPRPRLSSHVPATRRRVGADSVSSAASRHGLIASAAEIGHGVQSRASHCNSLRPRESGPSRYR